MSTNAKVRGQRNAREFCIYAGFTHPNASVRHVIQFDSMDDLYYTLSTGAYTELEVDDPNHSAGGQTLRQLLEQGARIEIAPKRQHVHPFFESLDPKPEK